MQIDSILDLRNLNLINSDNNHYNNLSKIKILFRNKEFKLNEIFKINIKNNSNDRNEINIIGTNKFFHNLGYRWRDSLIKTDGSVGSYLGYEMESGTVKIKGSSENFTGANMKGGKIIISGDTGDFLGSSNSGKKYGMNGGIIYVKGNAKNYMGFLMRRGLIYLGGSAGDFCCSKMIAGTVIVSKKVGKSFAVSMRRGSIVLLSKKKLSSEFLFCGEANSSFISLLSNSLNLNLKLKISGKRKFIRFTGDRSLNGLGEIIMEKS